MLDIYLKAIGVLRALRAVIAGIEAHDRDLARQLRRASTSIVLNMSEGSGSRGGHAAGALLQCARVGA